MRVTTTILGLKGQTSRSQVHWIFRLAVQCFIWLCMTLQY